jgi:hypothetical protein
LGLLALPSQLTINLDCRGPSPFSLSFYDCPQSQSQTQSHIATDGKSISLGVEAHLRLMTRYLLLFNSYGLVFCEALSDEKTGLSFVYVTGPRQRILSQFRLPWDSLPSFYCLKFYTSLFVASYDSQGHGGSIRPRATRV